MTPEPRVHASAATWPALVGCTVLSFVFVFATHEFLNDHFDRLARARQIAAYGDWPFEHFFDPGYFLSLMASALAYRWADDSLLGEVLLNTSFMAAGSAMILWLAVRASGSSVIGIAATAFSVLSMARAYDFDKVFFYPLGLVAIVRYVDRPNGPRAAAIAAVAVVAGLFRYDSGVYILASGLVAIAVVHGTDWGQGGRRIALVLGTAALLATPVLGFLAAHGGVSKAFDQVATYAAREGARTRLTALPSIAEPLVSLRGPVHLFPEPGRNRNAVAVTVYALFAAPIVALVVLVAHRRAGRVPAPPAAFLVAAAVMVAMLDTFILRDPVSARVGGMSGPVAVLLAWLASVVPRRRGLPWAARIGAAVVIAALALPLPVLAEWDRRLAWGAFAQPMIAAKIRRLSTPAWASLTVVDAHTAAFIRYLHACTQESDRVLATWYFPELYFFAQRGFAGGLPVVFGSHWSEERFERQSVARLTAEKPPVVFVLGDQFPSDYDTIAGYIDAEYRIGGTTDFGDGAGGRRYTVLVRRDRPAVGLDSRWNLPCFK